MRTSRAMASESSWISSPFMARRCARLRESLSTEDSRKAKASSQSVRLIACKRVAESKCRQPLIEGLYSPCPQTPDHSRVRLVRGDGEVKAGLRKVVFEVGVRIAVILTPRGGAEKLSGEHTAITKAKVQSFIHFVLGNHIEFVADVPASSGMSRNRNSPTAGVVVVIRGHQPVAFKLLDEFPFFCGVFYDSGSELLQIPAADQIVEAELVMIRGI